jgi:hypothetical protein
MRMGRVTYLAFQPRAYTKKLRMESIGMSGKQRRLALDRKFIHEATRNGTEETRAKALAASKKSCEQISCPFV